MLLYSRGTVLLLLSLAAALFVPAVCHVASSSPHAPTDRSESDSDQKPLKNIQRTRNVFRASLQSSVGSMAKHGGNDTTPAACSFTRTGETAWLCDGRGMRIGIDVASGALLNVSANGVLVSPGSRGGCLWGLVFADGSYAGGCGYPSAPDLTWDQATCTLSLIYATAGSEPLKRPLGRAMPYAARSWAMNACVPNVTATLTVDTASSVDGVGRLVTSASVALPTSCPVVATELLWLSDLVLPVATIADTFLPLLPGINLTAAFYRQPTPHVLSNTYPGRSWAADIVSWSVAGGARMASISPRRPSDAITAVNAAVVGQAADDWFYHHTYPFALHAGERFTTPPLLLAVGMFDFETLMDVYRTEGAVGAYPSLRTKLGDRFSAFATSPLLKLDAKEFNGTFSTYAAFVNATVDRSSLVHICAIEPNGFDRFYPDLLPPAAVFGTTQDLADAVTALKTMGHLTMPYTNPTWWDVQSPTIQSYLAQNITLADFCALNATHEAVWESYGPNTGVVVEPHCPRVQARLTELLHNMTQTVPFDAVFEDQIGARPWMIDPSPWEPTPEDYIAGWLNHTQSAASRGLLLMTEQGFDALSQSEVSFCGSYLENKLDGSAARDFGGNYTWHFLPFSAFAYRESVLLNPHNLAVSTFVNSLEIITFSMAMGYQLAYELSWARNPALAGWLRPTLGLQHLVIGPHVDQPAVSFSTLVSSVTTGVPQATLTTFADNTTTLASWAADDSGAPTVAVGAHRVAPGGFHWQGNALSAGAYVVYNNYTLNGSSHIVVEDRSNVSHALQGRTRVWHLLGSDTGLAVSLQGACVARASGDLTVTPTGLAATAIATDGSTLGAVPVTRAGDVAVLSMTREVGGKAVDSVVLQWQCSAR